jgi:hypothetical protein
MAMWRCGKMTNRRYVTLPLRQSVVWRITPCGIICHFIIWQYHHRPARHMMIVSGWSIGHMTKLPYQNMARRLSQPHISAISARAFPVGSRSCTASASACA